MCVVMESKNNTGNVLKFKEAINNSINSLSKELNRDITVDEKQRISGSYKANNGAIDIDYVFPLNGTPSDPPK